jgi:hypothetical protein
METELKFPACFSSRADYERWLDSSNTEQHLLHQHCTDCLPSYKMRMAKLGRCEHPETSFSFEPSSFDGEDGVEISGHWTRTRQQFQIVRFVKPRGRPPQRKKPEKLDTKAQREESARNWFAERQRALMEKLNR